MLRLTQLLLALLLAVVATGCRGDRSDEPPRQFFPGMDDQPKYRAQSENTFFEDGRTVREPVTGTVAFGRTAQADDFRRSDFLRDDDELYRGVDSSGAYLEYIPVNKVLRDGQSMQDLIARGREMFNIYCLPCHGGTGLGDGMVGSRWSIPSLPSFHDPQYQRGGEKGQDGYIFHTIRNGFANPPGIEPPLRMPAYGKVVSERDAWAIVSYFRTLQRARGSGIDDVPAAEAQELQRTSSAGANAEGVTP